MSLKEEGRETRAEAKGQLFQVPIRKQYSASDSEVLIKQFYETYTLIVVGNKCFTPENHRRYYLVQIQWLYKLAKVVDKIISSMH